VRGRQQGWQRRFNPVAQVDVHAGLVVDGVVKAAGKVPKPEEIKKLLEEERK
jgi:hypothetical protein